MSSQKDVSSEMMASCSSPNVDDQVLATDWDPLLSMDHNMNFHSYIMGASEFNGVGTSNSGRSDQVPDMPCFGGKNFSEMVGSYTLCENSQVSSVPSPAELSLGVDKNLKGKKRKGAPEFAVSHPHSPSDKLQVDSEQQNNSSPESAETHGEKDEKRGKADSGLGGNNSYKSVSKHAKANPQNAETGKDDYIHVRAKRGQATNSHSLAERVRREKISERMRLLQDLVPGCNKITGKAMMLDEIINYVQSLQRQVEFLSMKLAAVNPELNFDIEQILSKDTLHSQVETPAALAFGQGTNTARPHLHRSMQTDIGMYNSMQNSGGLLRLTTPHIPQLVQPPRVWENDIHNVNPNGFHPSSPY